MDRQEIFNKVVEGLASQGFRRSRGIGPDGVAICAYRGSDGLKCAAGHLIPDDMYIPEMEGLAIDCSSGDWEDGMKGRDALEKVRAKLGAFSAGDRQFLYRLQRTHDQGRCPKDMINGLINLGADYELQLPDSLKVT